MPKGRLPRPAQRGEVVAIRIIALARGGPIDPTLLTGRVLHEVHRARPFSTDSETDRPRALCNRRARPCLGLQAGVRPPELSIQ